MLILEKIGVYVSVKNIIIERGYFMISSVPKKAKIIFAVFILLLVIGVAVPIVHAAYDYDSFKPELMEHINVRTGWSNIGRNISFGLLKFLASGVTGIEEQLDKILKFDVASLFQSLGLVDSSGTISRSLLLSVFSIFLLIGACSLVIFRSKIHLSEFLVGILTSLAMIIAIPLFISTLGEMKTAGLKSTDNIKYTNQGTDTYHTLGDEILASSIIDVKLSADNNKLSYYSSYTDRQEGAVFNTLDINAVTSQDDFDKKVESFEADAVNSNARQREYSQIQNDNPARMQLLGLGQEMDLLRQSNEQGEPYPDIVDYSQPGVTGTASNIAEEMAQRYSTHFVTYTYSEYYSYLVGLICQKIAENFPNDYTVTSARNHINGYTGSIDTVLDQFQPQIEQLLRRENYAIFSVYRSSHINYQYEDLRSEKEYEDDWWWNRLGFNIATFGEPVEYIYRYDYDFWPTLVILLALIIAMIFAGLKIATVIYDMIFVQIIGGIIIATDQRNNGRAKKTIQEMFNTYLIFILCALLIKLYIILSLKIIQTNYNNFIKVILIIGFAKATIDGPDFIVKLTGADAGVKSGAAAVMAMNSGLNMARSVTSPITRRAAKIGGAAGRTATGGAVGMVSGGIAGGKAGGKKGAVGGAFVGAVKGAQMGFHNGNENAVGKNPISAGHKFGKQAGTAFTASGIKGALFTGGGTGGGSAPAPSGGGTGGGSAPAPSGGGTGGGSAPAPSGGGTGGGSAPAPSGGGTGGGSTSAPSGSGTGGGSAPAGGVAVVQNKAEKGDKGNKGEKGDQGLTGNTGDRGRDGQNAEAADKQNGIDPNNSQPTSSAAPSAPSGGGKAFSSTSSTASASAPKSNSGGSFADTQRQSEISTSDFAAQEKAAESSSATFAEQEKANFESQTPSFAEQELANEKKNSSFDE